MKLVIFGAGRIGRSFVAPVFDAAGYKIVFVDVADPILNALAERDSYQVVTLHPDGTRSTTRVSGVSGINGTDTDAVTSAVAEADLAATAVGAAGFDAVCSLISGGFKRRQDQRPADPLDVILAENIPGAARRAKSLIVGDGAAANGSADRAGKWPGRNLGLVETSIGKMVPIMPADLAAKDPLLVYAEPYNTLIVDAKGFAGPVPEVPNIKAVDNIRAYVDRKLFIHNLGHAAVAYLGHLADPNHKTIAEALSDSHTAGLTRKSMLQSAAGLHAEYPGEFTSDDLTDHIDDLLDRFGNRALGDTVFRVGRDLSRKLGPNDRIVGAMKLLSRHSLPMDAVAQVYRAAIRFDATDEFGAAYPGDAQIVEGARTNGVRWVIETVSLLGTTDASERQIRSAILQTSKSAHWESTD